MDICAFFGLEDYPENVYGFISNPELIMLLLDCATEAAHQCAVQCFEETNKFVKLEMIPLGIECWIIEVAEENLPWKCHVPHVKKCYEKNKNEIKQRFLSVFHDVLHSLSHDAY